MSTGGTATALEKAGYSVTRVEEITSFPEMVSVYVRFFFCLVESGIDVSSLRD